MICFIGNSGVLNKRIDGQTSKVRLYLKKIKDEGFDVDFVDLESFTKHPLSCLIKIKRSFKRCDRIVLLTAERGSKILIPYINFLNKKAKKPFIFPLIGISTLHYSLDKLSDQEKNEFFIKKDFSKFKVSKRVKKHLSKITYVLPETDLLCEVFKKFYSLDNVHHLNNFREGTFAKHKNNGDNKLKLIFISRVMEVKGIFDLMETVQDLNNNGISVYLDIYGGLSLNNQEKCYFNELLDKNFINYKGVISNDSVISTMSSYDLFVFPTKYRGEGTPGVIVESLLAGTPILTSSFPQASYLLKNGVDSLFFDMGNKEDLKTKLMYIINNKNILNDLKEGANRSGKEYTYDHEWNKFLKYICGKEGI